MDDDDELTTIDTTAVPADDQSVEDPMDVGALEKLSFGTGSKKAFLVGRSMTLNQLLEAAK